MARMKLKTTEVWRVDSENEALEMIETARESQNDNGYTVTNSQYKLKVKKSKGEIIDQFYDVTISYNYVL